MTTEVFRLRLIGVLERIALALEKANEADPLLAIQQALGTPDGAFWKDAPGGSTESDTGPPNQGPLTGIALGPHDMSAADREATGQKRQREYEIYGDMPPAQRRAIGLDW